MFCAGSRRKKIEQKPTIKNFVGFHNHAPLLTMVQTIKGKSLHKGTDSFLFHYKRLFIWWPEIRNSLWMGTPWSQSCFPFTEKIGKIRLGCNLYSLTILVFPNEQGSSKFPTVQSKWKNVLTICFYPVYAATLPMLRSGKGPRLIPILLIICPGCERASFPA